MTRKRRPVPHRGKSARLALPPGLEPFHPETGPDETKYHAERPVQIIWPIAGRRHSQQLARRGQERTLYPPHHPAGFSASRLCCLLVADREPAVGRGGGTALVDVATIGILQERAVRHQDVVAGQLQVALNSRVIIEQGKGVLAERLRVTPDEAFAILRRYARDHNHPLTELAVDVTAARHASSPAGSGK